MISTPLPLRFLFLFCSLAALSAAAQQPPTRSADVVIYGGTSAGVIAAVQSSRLGQEVVLVEAADTLGGLTSGGLGWTDLGRPGAVGGLSLEFYQRVHDHYMQDSAWHQETRDEYIERFLKIRPHARKLLPSDGVMSVFEPHVAEEIFETMLAEQKVPVLRNCGGIKSIEVDGGRILSFSTESGTTLRGRIFIDATYEGDLLAAAGVSYHVGREAAEVYDEQLNGVRPELNTHSHRFVVDVDPYVVPGDPSSGLLPGIESEPIAASGSGDDKIQAYCFRMCLTDDPENKIPFTKPDDYDPQLYELLLRNFAAGDHRLPLKIDPMPNRKTDINNNCAVSTDFIGQNYSFPEADPATRKEIVARHLSYQQGLMWTLSNHPRVPEEIRKQVSRWGLPKDEFEASGHWPHTLYIREGRRMLGPYVMTEHDCRRLRVCEDSIGLGSYNMDSHNCQRYVTAAGFVQNEGDVQESPGGPYAISYRSITPKREQIENLLVPVALSASHIAFGSIRMEPVFMVLAQSAATAATLALEQDVAVQDVPYADLRKRLLNQGQVLDIEAVLPNASGTLSLEGNWLDDSRAERRGSWTASSSTQPFAGFGYLHDGAAGDGNASLIYRLTALENGRYRVLFYYPRHANRARNAKVTVAYSNQSHVLVVDQRGEPGQGRTELGTYDLEAGDEVAVTVSNHYAEGYVVADAVALVPQQDSEK